MNKKMQRRAPSLPHDINQNRRLITGNQRANTPEYSSRPRRLPQFKKFVGNLMDSLKRSSLIPRKMLENIINTENKFFDLLARISRMVSVEIQARSSYPRDYWTLLISFYTTITNFLNEHYLNSFIKLRNIYEKCKKTMEMFNEKCSDATDLFENVSVTLEAYLDRIENNVEVANGKDELSRIIGSIRMISSLITYARDPDCDSGLFFQLEQILADHLNTIHLRTVFMKNFIELYQYSESTIYKADEIDALPQPLTLCQIKHKREMRKENLRGQNGVHDLSILNDEKVSQIKKKKESKRTLQDDLDLMRDQSKIGESNHRIVNVVRNSTKSKFEKLRLRIASLKTEVEQMTQRRELLKEELNRLSFEESNRCVNKDANVVQPSDDLIEENKNLTTELSKLKQKKELLEDEWIKLRARNHAIISNMDSESSLLLRENSKLRTEYVNLSRKHLYIVEKSLKQQFMNERARCLGSMKLTNEDNKMSYNEALSANAELINQIDNLCKQRDYEYNKYLEALAEKYTIEERMNKLDNGSSILETKLLGELENAKSEYIERQSSYLKEIQTRLSTSIRNKIAKSDNKIADLRSSAYEDISRLNEIAKILQSEYDELREKASYTESYKLEFVEHRGNVLTLEESSKRLEEIVDEFSEINNRIRQRAVKEAEDELRELIKDNTDFENRAKEMKIWTEELYEGAMQAYAKAQTLNTQAKLYAQKDKDPSIDVNVLYRKELEDVKSEKNNYENILKKVSDILYNLISEPGESKRDLSIEECIDEINTKYNIK